MIRINPLLLRQRAYNFQSKQSNHLFSISIQEFLCVSTPPLDPDRKMNKSLFLGTHTGFVTPKRIMVTPPLTTSFMNFIVIEIHVLPRQNFELAILLPSRHGLRGEDDSFGST
uniref:hypothetical protein n=1 Tax=Drosera capensis TaxID=4366 RepID=UPI002410E410|nr:hypothetical protein P8577_pgp048 [Drosera capensis]YP_010737257.1 hypothetical protein P8577_pgp007 [Drosera capensis]WEQ03475.1 hypothetical protein [Drosera capensis]WEQ03516.1 hypothetical protein [Drosera capensis]